MTIRGLDEETDRRVKELASRRRISLNRAAKLLIRRGSGLDEESEGPAVIGHALDALAGKWSREEERELLDSIRDTGQIDKELWA